MPLWEAREPVDGQWAPWKSEELLTSVRGIGVTTASKLIARKRPQLYPVNDKVGRDLVRPANVMNDWKLRRHCA
jgi:hypothetical protein